MPHSRTMQTNFHASSITLLLCFGIAALASIESLWAEPSPNAVFITTEQYRGILEKANEAVDAHPDDPKGYTRRGYYLLRGRLYVDAAVDFRRALSKDPHYVAAIRGMASADAGMGQYTDSLDEINKVIQLQTPPESRDYVGRARVEWFLRRTEEAMSDFQHAVGIDPKNVNGIIGEAELFGEAHNYGNAFQILDRAYESLPKNYNLSNELGWFLATCPDSKFRNGQRAVQIATEACLLSKYNYSHCLDTLAAAYAETNDFDQAIKWETAAMNRKGISRNQHYNERMRLYLYRQHEPYREFVAR